MAGTREDELWELLLDLKHDLGKYIAFPIVMLPVEAEKGEVKVALARALKATRTGPTGVVPAARIWGAFLEAADGEFDRFSSFPGLVEAVGNALALESLLEDEEGHLRREHLESVLRGVGVAVGELMSEVARHRRQGQEGPHGP